MSEEVYDPSGPTSSPKQPKRGCFGKAFIIIGIVSAIFFVLCCGVGAWVVNSIRNAFTTDRAEIAAIQQDITDITVPEGLNPVVGLDLTTFKMFGFTTQWVVFGNQPAGQAQGDAEKPEGFEGTFLMLIQLQVEGADPAEFEAQLKKESNQQGADIRVESMETRTVEIDGKEVEFEFAQGTNNENNQKVRSVSGVFQGRGGPTLLMYVIPEEEWDEEEAMSLLKSIHR